MCLGSVAIAAGAAMSLFAGAPAHAGEVASSDRFAHGLLWRVERAGAPFPSYVYGTLHVSDERTARLPAAVSALVDRLAIVATEITFERRDIARISDRLYLPEGERLSSRLDAAEYRALVEMLADSGVPAAKADRLTPFGAIAFLAARPNAARPSLDVQIFNLAKANQLKTIGLESVDEQFDTMSRTGDERMLDELRAAVRAPKRFREGVERTIRTYLSEGIGELAATAGGKTNGAAGEEVIENRNVRMLERMRPLVDSGSALIAVGAAHLGGESGLLAALESAGYKVVRADLN